MSRERHDSTPSRSGAWAGAHGHGRPHPDSDRHEDDLVDAVGWTPGLPKLCAQPGSALSVRVIAAG
jgi:hypothetical protein